MGDPTNDFGFDPSQGPDLLDSPAYGPNQGVNFDPGSQPIAMGADPFAGGDITDDAASGAVLPGEDIIPFEGGGMDSSAAANALATAFGSGGTGVSLLPADFSFGGPMGLQYKSPSGGGVPAPTPGGGGHPTNPGASRVKAILASITLRIGRHVSLTAAIGYIRKWGLPAASTAFGLGADDLGFLLAYKALRASGRGRRGPHLKTVLKRIHRGKHYEHLLRKYASKAGIHHHAASSPPFYPRRRRTHHKRRK